MTILSRRQTLLGITVTAAVFTLPGMAKAAPAETLPCTGITWDGRHPSSPCAARWEDRRRWLLWKRVGDQWVCLGTILDPVHTTIGDGGGPGIETYVQALPARDLFALSDESRNRHQRGLKPCASGS
jgi:hypothetical protein